MATLSQQLVAEAGLNASYAAAAAGGDTFNNDGSDRQFLHVKNAHAANPRTVTITAEVASKKVSGYGTMTRANISVAIPALGNKFIGPIALNAFGVNPAITYSDSAADLTVALLKI